MYNLEGGVSSMSGLVGVWGILNGLLALAGIAVSIICVVLFIKLAVRGIKALDIYI